MVMTNEQKREKVCVSESVPEDEEVELELNTCLFFTGFKTSVLHMISMSSREE